MKGSMCSLFVVGALAHHAFAQPAPAPTPDDLSKAADAAAEIAAVPAAPLKTSSDDIDLSSMGLDPAGSAFDDKLNVYGYADIAYRGSHAYRHTDIFPDQHGFAFGNLNIYAAKNLTPKARALAEVQYTFLPNGTAGAGGTTIDTTVADPANDQIPTKWGGVVIQRAYLEYDVTEYLTIRAGHWLTPYGIWNTDHGSPVIITVSRPYIIDAGLFPEHQTGLDLFGSRHVSDFKLSYHVTVSNGRSETEAQIDRDNKLAFGGRLEAETSWGLRIGGSYYRGRYTGLAAMPGAAPHSYREESYGGDAQFDHDGLHVQGEVATRRRHYTSVMDAGVDTGGTATTTDISDTGFYILGGYRFNLLWNVMPFSYYQYYKASNESIFSSVNVEALGLNFRPTGSMVFKLQVQRGKLADGVGFVAGTIQYTYLTQAAWVF